MAQNERPGPHGDPLEDAANVEDNRAQRDSDVPPDSTGERSDRADGRGSDANGIPAFDEADGEQRKKLYRGGAELVSKID